MTEQENEKALLITQNKSISVARENNNINNTNLSSSVTRTIGDKSDLNLNAVDDIADDGGLVEPKLPHPDLMKTAELEKVPIETEN